jgi:drug/metabolite transporter (DMT)-like permease
MGKSRLNSASRQMTPLRNGSSLALIQTALTGVLWGTSFPVTALGLKGGLDPTTFLLLRFAIAAPLMVAFSAAMGRRFIPLFLSKEVWVIGGLNTAGFLCQYVGQQYADASVATLLVNLSVVMAAVGGALFLGERIGPLKSLGIVFAVVGTALVATNGSVGGTGGEQLLGDFLFIMAALTWTGYILYAKMKTDQLGWDPVPLAAAIVTVTAILVAPFAAFVGVGEVEGGALWIICYTAVLNTAIPYILYQQGLRYLTASTSALLLTLQIVVGVGVSVAFLGEALGTLAWVGAGVIIASVLLVSGLEVGAKSH